jgi:hypothetical protein
LRLPTGRQVLEAFAREKKAFEFQALSVMTYSNIVLNPKTLCVLCACLPAGRHLREKKRLCARKG